jgi:hypothetical protein
MFATSGPDPYRESRLLMSRYTIVSVSQNYVALNRLAVEAAAALPLDGIFGIH